MPQQPSQGFILSRHQFERRGQTFLEFWLATDNGPVNVKTPAQPWTFFVRRQDVENAHSALSAAALPFDTKPLELSTFGQDAVNALYFKLSRDFYRARDLLQEQGIETLEADIRLSDRFLMERFVYGSAVFAGQPADARRHRYPAFEHAKFAKSDYRPALSVISLDIECSEKGELYSIGLAGTDYRCVIMIGEPQSGPDWIRWVADEIALLKALNEEILQQDPDVFIGWAVVSFDFRLLIRRSDALSVPLTLGRDGSAIHWREAKGKQDSDQGYVVMPGRIVIDGIDALKTATYQFDSFSLEFVAQELLGEGKKTHDVDNRIGQINHDFRHNKVALAEYNLQDCELVQRIFAHTRLLDFLILRSKLTGLEMDRPGGSVAAFLNLYMPKLHRAGYVSPNRPSDGGLASPGGYVMNSKPGLYKHVLVLDFKSLYPSIIRTFKIDPLGLIEGLNNPEKAIPGFKGASFHRDKHFLPDIITSLWQQRDEAKRDKDAGRSQAIKILMNSFYGVLGSGGCPFYDTRLASSITMRGHDIMQTTAKWIEDAGHQVIYGDTDSTFVHLQGDIDDDSADAIGQGLAADINRRWRDKIADEFSLESQLEIEFETHFRRFLMPTIRGSDVGSKKRYAGLRFKDGEESIVFKGLETVRSDWTPLSKQFQTQLYEMVFRDQDPREFVQGFVADTRAGLHDDQLVYRKRLRRPLDAYQKNIPPQVRAARLADERNGELGKPLKYQRRGWVSYLITLAGPQPLEYQDSRPDYDHYVDKQIRPVAEAILPFVDLDFDAITSDQLGLF